MHSLRWGRQRIVEAWDEVRKQVNLKEDDPFAMGGKKLLKKYDEVIDERHGQKSFQIGEDGKIDTTMVDIRRQMREDMAANAISLK